MENATRANGASKDGKLAAQELENTGERFLPGANNAAEMAYDHIARYRLAERYVEDRDIVDMGCGAGYGSHSLSRLARSVRGMDLSEEAIAHAERRYHSSNLSYGVGDVTKLPYESGSFETAVSFEVIEHLERPEDLVVEAKRVLKDDGIFIVSTPDKQAYSNDRNSVNPFHVSEMYPLEFREILERHFGYVQIYRQGTLAGSIITPDPNELPGDGQVTLESAQFSLDEPGLSLEAPATLYLIAVCTNGTPPEPLEGPHLILDRDRQIYEEAVGLLTVAAQIKAYHNYKHRVLAARIHDGNRRLREANEETRKAHQKVRRLDDRAKQMQRQLQMSRAEMAAMRNSRGMEGGPQAQRSSHQGTQHPLWSRPGARGAGRVGPGASPPGPATVSAHGYPEVLRSYKRWTVLTDPGSWDMVRMRNAVPGITYKPTVNILLPVYDPDRAWLERALDSVMSQTYPFWELCVCDDASTKPHVRETLDLYTRIDGRIKVKRLEENENIVGATNHALSMATGEWVGMLDHDDELAPHALFEVVKFLQDHRDVDLIYSDEDKIDEDPASGWTHTSRPAWSHDLAMEANYLNHFSVYRKTLLEELGGWREGFDGAQDLELVQRVGEKTNKIHRIPKVLYHWRAVTGSTAVSAEGKPYTHEKARRAIEESLGRQGIAGTVEDSGLMPNTFRVRREILGRPKVSVISWSDGGDETCLSKLRENTNYDNHELLVLDTGEATLKGEKTERLPGTKPVEMLNEAVRRATGEYVVLLGPDLEAVSGEWLESMLQHAQREKVGVVGGRLLLPSEQVYQAGLILVDETRDGRHILYRNCDRGSTGYELYFALNRNCTAVSSQCMMFRKATFEEAGGFDEAHFDDAFADVDLCLRLRERGLSTVFTPYANFKYHGPQHGPAQPDPEEAEYARERWGSLLREDPYHSPNLLWDPEDTDMIKGKPFAPGPAQRKKDEEAAGAATEAQQVPLHSPRASVEVPPPFFIVGHGRSGTTWLELTMNSHPEIACKGSGMFFGRDMPLYEDQRALPAALANSEDLKTWHDMRPNYWSRNTFEEDLPGITKALANYTMGVELAASGKKLAGDRTPHYVSYLNEVHELYPEAKVIHVIRDGRDVAISNIHAIWQNARDKGGPVDLEPEVQRKRDTYLEDREAFLENGESIFTGYRINQLAESWRDAVNKGREDGRQLFGDDYVEVRYEDLLDDPHAELERLFGFLGVDDSEKVIGRAVEENRFEKVTGRTRGQEDPNHFNRKGVAGDWREVFTDRDRRVFEEKAGDTLAGLGYEANGAPPDKPTAGEKPEKKPAGSSAPAVRGPSQASPPFFVVGTDVRVLRGRSGYSIRTPR